jgi:hypothetical protein
MVGLLAFFVVVIALLYALFKLWFELLKAYVSILISIVFAPFWIVAGLIPGSGEKVGFGAWLRNMLGNLMAFPVAIGMFFMAAYFAQQFAISYGASGTKVFFIPPLVGSQSEGFGVVIAFGILMMTPHVVKTTRTIFKTTGLGIGPSGINTGTAAMGALGGAIGNRLYYRGRNAQGQMITSGPLATLQTRAANRLYQSRIASPVRAVRRSGAGTKLGWNDIENENRAAERAREARQEQVGIHAEAIQKAHGTSGASPTTSPTPSETGGASEAAQRLSEEADTRTNNGGS